MDIELVQDLLDSGMPIKQIADQLGVERTKIFRLIQKGTVEKYVSFDEMPFGFISDSDIYSLFTISDGFKVAVDGDKKNWLMKHAQWAQREDEMFDAAKKEVELTAIGEFILHIEPSELSYDLLKEYRHIESMIYRNYGSIPTFRKQYNIPVEFCDLALSIYKFAELGREFESLVAEVLAEISVGDIRAQAIQPDQSRPDFIVDDHAWVDAKLSRSTVFNPSCKTLDKYTAQAGSLTIIYAIKDCLRTDPRAEFVHIVSLLPVMSVPLRTKTLDFVSKAQHFKEAA